jgi:hypothetical protein
MRHFVAYAVLLGEYTCCMIVGLVVKYCKFKTNLFGGKNYVSSTSVI